jgi:hypothetical protein
MQKLALSILLILFFLSGFIFLTFQRTEAKGSTAAPLLVQTFSATHARIERYSVRGWSVMQGKWMEFAEVYELARSLAVGMKIGEERYEGSKKSGENEVRIYGQWDPQTQVMVSVLSVARPDMDTQTVISLTVDRETDSLDRLGETLARMQQVASAQGFLLETSTNLQGTLPQPMDEQQQETFIHQLLARAGATEVEGLKTRRVTSISAYSPSIGQHILSREKPVNLQVALHADTYHRNTRVIVGSPLITVEY